MANMFVGASITEKWTAAQLEQGKGAGIGDRYIDNAGREYVFVVFGTGGATASFLVSIDMATHTAVMTSNTASLRGQLVGVYAGDTAALIGEYGWVQIYGPASIQVSASCAANALITTTTTAGELDDAAGVGTKTVAGIVLTTARAASAGQAPAMLIYPNVTITN
jgi:hypothetical protein